MEGDGEGGKHFDELEKDEGEPLGMWKCYDDLRDARILGVRVVGLRLRGISMFGMASQNWLSLPALRTIQDLCAKTKR